MRISVEHLRQLIREVIETDNVMIESPRGRRREFDTEYTGFIGSSAGAPSSIEMVSNLLAPSATAASPFATRKTLRKTYVWTQTGETVNAISKDVAYILFKDMLMRHSNDEINARSNPNYEKNDFWENVKLRIEDIEEVHPDYEPRGGTNESTSRVTGRLRGIVIKMISEALASDEREFISGTEFEKYFDRNNEFTDPKANQRRDQQVYQRDVKKDSPGNWAHVKELAMEEYKKDLAKRRRAGLEFGDATNLISKYFVSLASFMRFRKEVLPRLSKRYEELSAKKSLSPEAARERLYCLEAIKTSEIFGEVLKSSVRDFASKVATDREKSLVAKDDTVSLRPSAEDQAALAFGRQFSALDPERRSQLATSLGRK